MDHKVMYVTFEDDYYERIPWSNYFWSKDMNTYIYI